MEPFNETQYNTDQTISCVYIFTHILRASPTPLHFAVFSAVGLFFEVGIVGDDFHCSTSVLSEGRVQNLEKERSVAEIMTRAKNQ